MTQARSNAYNVALLCTGYDCVSLSLRMRSVLIIAYNQTVITYNLQSIYDIVGNNRIAPTEAGSKQFIRIPPVSLFHPSFIASLYVNSTSFLDAYIDISWDSDTSTLETYYSNFMAMDSTYAQKCLKYRKSHCWLPARSENVRRLRLMPFATSCSTKMVT